MKKLFLIVCCLLFIENAVGSSLQDWEQSAVPTESLETHESCLSNMMPSVTDLLLTTTGLAMSLASEGLQRYAPLTLSLGISSAHFTQLRSIVSRRYRSDHEIEEQVGACLKLLVSFSTTIPIAIYPELAPQLTMTFFTGVAIINVLEKVIKKVRLKKKASVNDIDLESR